MKHIDNRQEQLRRLIDVAAGRIPADLVLKNAAYVNVYSHSICHGDIAVVQGRIAGIGAYCGNTEKDVSGCVVLPGFMDAHIHLESSLVSPSEFAEAVLPHGTTTIVTDPHEIANVLGTEGISYMLEATQDLPVDVFFMLPSCVPATPLDEGGAALHARQLAPFYEHPRVLGLAEVMNASGVAAGDPLLCEKLAASPLCDGHAPGLSEMELNAYTAAGIRSDHECSDPEDALRKLERGQFIMLREGTAARNLEALCPLLVPQYIDRCLLCCDDRHPNELLKEGHIDFLLRKAVSLGTDPILAVQAATLNTARYFGLNDRGAIAPGLNADLVLVDDLVDFRVRSVYKNGLLYSTNGCISQHNATVCSLSEHAMDSVHIAPFSTADLSDTQPRSVIGMLPGEIVTVNCGFATAISVQEDILKLAVIERHHATGHIGLGYLKGYGLTSGAIAASVAHDSHNLIVAGANEADMIFAVRQVTELHGGIVVVQNGRVLAQLALPIAGLMSTDRLADVNTALEQAKEAAFSLGVSRQIDPFMTLSFMSLPVIPTLRITTHGVVNVADQSYISR